VDKVLNIPFSIFVLKTIVPDKHSGADGLKDSPKPTAKHQLALI